MKLLIKFLKTLTFLLLMSSAAYGFDETNYRISDGNNSIEFGMGLLNGKSEELVYNNGRKLSQLNWELENVIMFGTKAEIGVNDRSKFNFSIWTKLDDGSGEMDDYDWLDGDGDSDSWTRHSNHETHLDKAYMLDMNLEYAFKQAIDYKFSTSLGFRHDRFKWEAYDGDGTYLDLGSDIEFYGTGVTYDQKLYSPYLGINFNYKKDKWVLNTYLRGSLWAWAEAEDVHYSPAGSKDGVDFSAGEQRTYKDEVDDIHYLAYGAKLSYFLREDILIGASFDVQKYFETKGKGEIDGSTYDAGLSNYSYIIAIMAGYRF